MSQATAQQTSNEAAIALLDEWLRDESGYDENVWHELVEVIERHRLSARKRFENAANDAGHRTARKDRSSAS